MRTGGSLTLAVLLCTALAADLAGLPGVAGECELQENRPQYHFSPKKNWINDPNGLIYYDDEWHMFYQYEPTATKHNGHVSWGHAVSKDLIHWEELDVAIPATDSEQIFSGSAVIDKDNSAGFGANAMVAIYTSADKTSSIQSQSIAYSLDKGRTFTKYANNPVLNLQLKEFRDPNVQWYEPGKFWLMAVSLADDRKISFYKSVDLKKWDKLSDFGPAGATTGQYECPDLFKLPVVGGSQGESKWVLIVNVNPGGLQGGSAGQYFIGTFDGTKFTADDDQTRWLDVGKDNYAAITWKGAPNDDVYMIGWMSNWQYSAETPTDPWRNAMTLPRRLTLQLIDGKVVLKQAPVNVVESLQKGSSTSFTSFARSPSSPSLALSGESLDVSSTLSKQGARARRGIADQLHGKAYYLRVTLSDPTRAKRQGIKVRVGKDQYTSIVYDSEKKTLSIDRTKSGKVDFDATNFPGVHGYAVELRDNKLKLDVYVDWGSVEVFANDGELAITDTIFPDATSDGVELFVEEGQGDFEGLQLRELTTYRDCN